MKSEYTFESGDGKKIIIKVKEEDGKLVVFVDGGAKGAEVKTFFTASNGPVVITASQSGETGIVEVEMWPAFFPLQNPPKLTFNPNEDWRRVKACFGDEKIAFNSPNRN